MQQHFHSNGKLLLTSEYLVIDGAKALALPCQYGQNLAVETMDEPEIIWESYTDEGKLWFEAIFTIEEDEIKNLPYQSEFQEEKTAQRLVQIFNELLKMNPELFQKKGYIFKSRLEFPQIWGLGSSSTLLNNLAAWAKVDAFELSDKTFGGSAYDIACAQNSSPILYQRKSAEKPLIEKVDFNPDYKNFLFFVHLGRKQNTRESVSRYKKLNQGNKEKWIKKTSEITEEILKAKDLFTFEKLIEEHERLISDVLELHSMQNALFIDYPRIIKSLGAWGGDFILATGGSEERKYFEDKGYTTIVKYRDMIL